MNVGYTGPNCVEISHANAHGSDNVLWSQNVRQVDENDESTQLIEYHNFIVTFRIRKLNVRNST